MHGVDGSPPLPPRLPPGESTSAAPTRRRTPDGATTSRPIRGSPHTPSPDPRDPQAVRGRTPHGRSSSRPLPIPLHLGPIGRAGPQPDLHPPVGPSTDLGLLLICQFVDTCSHV